MVELDWLRVEPPESDSGLASPGSRAYFLFTRGLIMVSKLVCQDASRTDLKKKKKAEVLGLGFFHALVSDFQQEKEGI